MTIKDAVYRELRFGGVLAGLVDGANIKQDLRNEVDEARDEGSYPIVVFRRVTSPEDNQVKFASARIEIELIGLVSSATKGDDLLEQAREAIIDHFAGKHATWGKFEADGTADPDGGLRMKAVYVDTVDGFSEELDEKIQLVLFDFSYLRA